MDGELDGDFEDDGVEVCDLVLEFVAVVSSLSVFDPGLHAVRARHKAANRGTNFFNFFPFKINFCVGLNLARGGDGAVVPVLPQKAPCSVRRFWLGRFSSPLMSLDVPSKMALDILILESDFKVRPQTVPR
ncbi:hypothetical protein CPHO_00465 [Corynebacterium phocae]|uniref:Uncharacterized protein n=1 Tax=Corynebacterium phocae TaxID=161895 RepID=A0A1L7D0R3_9CORY|nr:hypothetical protein CPHO_00465 [Corynebacterium phocae]